MRWKRTEGSIKGREGGGGERERGRGGPEKMEEINHIILASSPNAAKRGRASGRGRGRRGGGMQC